MPSSSASRLPSANRRSRTSRTSWRRPTRWPGSSAPASSWSSSRRPTPARRRRCCCPASPPPASPWGSSSSSPSPQSASIRATAPTRSPTSPRSWAACRQLACALYGQIVERVVPVSSPQAAEMVKLFENIFRSVNIALVNELAIMCRRLGLSVWEIIEAASTKPFGFMSFQPGPGIGGHCLPSDPYYLSWRARMMGYEARFIAFADEINRGMPGYTVQLAKDALNDLGRPLKGSRLLVLGVAYKAGVGDVRDSPAVEIIDALVLRGARVDYADPHVPTLTVGSRSLTAVDWAASLGAYDLVLVLTAHREFDPVRLVREARLVLDTRNLTGPLGAQPHVIRL